MVEDSHTHGVAVWMATVVDVARVIPRPTAVDAELGVDVENVRAVSVNRDSTDKIMSEREKMKTSNHHTLA